jgi:SNF2 family DNA or RNA helicase
MNILALKNMRAEMLPAHMDIANSIINEALLYKQGLEIAPPIMEGKCDIMQELNYQPKITPYRHQRIGVSLMHALRHLGLFLDCGAGKTGTVLLFLDLLQSHVLKRPIRALVAGKLMTLYSGWMEDCEKFTNLKCEVLWEPTNIHKTIVDRKALADNEVELSWLPESHRIFSGVFAPSDSKKCKNKSAVIVIDKRTGKRVFFSKGSVSKLYDEKKHRKFRLSWKETAEGQLVSDSLVATSEAVDNRRKTSIKERIAAAAEVSDTSPSLYVINHDGARIFAEDLQKVPWDVVVVDESTMIKSPTSKLFRCMCDIALHVPYRFILTGTPAPNGPQDLWSQMFFLDRGITLGDNYQVYLSNHFTKRRRVMGTREFDEWVANKSTLDWVASRLDGRHYRVALRDCADLPPLTIQTVDVYMNAKQQAAYDEMQENLITEIKGTTVEATTCLSKLTKLRQITGGFILSQDELVALEDNPKLDACVDFVADLVKANEQVVIFAVHVAEIEALTKAIPNSVAVYGKVGDEEKFSNIKSFIKGEAPVIICQPQSAAHGLTLVNARYLLFYSIDYSAETNYQAIKRVERITQKRAMFVYYFLVHKSIDRIIYKVIAKKIAAQSSLIDGLSAKDDEKEIIKQTLGVNAL